MSGGILDSGTSHRRGSTQSDTSALVSSLTRDPSQSPSGISSMANTTRDLSPSPSCSSLHMKSEEALSPTETPKKDDTTTSSAQVHYFFLYWIYLARVIKFFFFFFSLLLFLYFKDSQDASKKVSEAQTQTSPESATTAMKGHFPINSTNKDERSTPKFCRRDHTKVVKTRAKRAMSPASSQQASSPNHITLNLNKEKVIFSNR